LHKNVANGAAEVAGAVHSGLAICLPGELKARLSAGLSVASRTFSGFAARCLQDKKPENTCELVSGLFGFLGGLKGGLQARLPAHPSSRLHGMNGQGSGAGLSPRNPERVLAARCGER